MHGFPAEVQKPVPEPQLLGILRIAGDLYGQRFSSGFDTSLTDRELDIAGGKRGIDGVDGTLHHLSGQRDHTFGT